MAAPVSNLKCVRCGRPVDVNRQHFETFERMHWVCFHYEFEHDPADPDERCSDVRCPSDGLPSPIY